MDYRWSILRVSKEEFAVYALRIRNAHQPESRSQYDDEDDDWQETGGGYRQIRRYACHAAILSKKRM